MSLVDIREHIWGFGKCVIRPSSVGSGSISDLETHLHVTGELKYSPLFTEIQDEITLEKYRFPLGFRITVEMSDVKLFNSEANANDNGSMKTLVERLFPAINDQMARGVYPLFNMKLNIPEYSTWNDSSNCVELNDMYLDSDISLGRLKKNGMYGQTFSVKFIAKSIVNSIPLELTGYSSIIIASQGGTDYVITYSENSADYAIKIY